MDPGTGYGYQTLHTELSGPGRCSLYTHSPWLWFRSDGVCVCGFNWCWLQVSEVRRKDYSKAVIRRLPSG